MPHYGGSICPLTRMAAPARTPVGVPALAGIRGKFRLKAGLQPDFSRDQYFATHRIVISLRKSSRSGRDGSTARTHRTKRTALFRTRRIGFECLEERRLLSTIGLAAISNVTLPAGASVMVPLNGTDPNETINFGVTTSDPTKVSPTVMPQTNKSITFNIDGQGIVGAMTFQLFDNLTPGIASQIEALADAKVYNGDYIYRSSADSWCRAAISCPRSAMAK